MKCVASRQAEASKAIVGATSLAVHAGWVTCKAEKDRAVTWESGIKRGERFPTSTRTANRNGKASKDGWWEETDRGEEMRGGKILCDFYRSVRLACQPTNQQYCSLILNQHQPPTSQQYCLLITNQHHPPATAKQTIFFAGLLCDLPFPFSFDW